MEILEQPAHLLTPLLDIERQGEQPAHLPTPQSDIERQGEQPAHLPTPQSDIERQGCDRPEGADFDYSQRAQWLRAALLGANDGLVLTASLMMGAGAVKTGTKAMLMSLQCIESKTLSRSLLPSLNPPPTNKKKRKFREEKMTSTRPTTYFLLLLPFLLNSCFADQALMRDVCSRTSLSDDCFTYLSVDPRSVTANKRGLARISIELGVRGGSNIHDDITRLSAQTTDPDLKEDLSTCLDAYSIVVTALRTALGEFDQGDFVEVISLLASAGGAIDNCDQGFNVPPGTPASPIAHQDNITIKRCSISIDLVRQA